MKIIVNDAEHIVADGITVAQLVADMSIPEKGTAIAVNNKLVRKAEWADAALADGDKVVIISAAYGG